MAIGSRAILTKLILLSLLAFALVAWVPLSKRPVEWADLRAICSELDNMHNDVRDQLAGIQQAVDSLARMQADRREKMALRRIARHLRVLRERIGRAQSSIMRRVP